MYTLTIFSIEFCVLQARNLGEIGLWCCLLCLASLSSVAVHSSQHETSSDTTNPQSGYADAESHHSE